MRTIGIVGGSLAGLSAARALRTQGFDGRLVVVGDEACRPYDRPPLSKGFLDGTVAEADLALASEDEDLDIEWRPGAAANSLDTTGRIVHITDGTSLVVDAAILATGATPRSLPGASRLDHVHVLRTLADAIALRDGLRAAQRLVVVGGGLIGLEVASTARTLGLEVTVVDSQTTPLAPVIGPTLGQAVARLHGDRGVRLVSGARVARLTGSGRVDGVELQDGRRLGADIVVIGIGVRPAVDWLTGSPVRFDGRGVLCDAGGLSSVPNVAAVGDCSAWFDPALGDHRCEEHWTPARTKAAGAVTSLLAGRTIVPQPRAAYFWSEQYGMQLQIAGRVEPGDELSVEEGTLEHGRFLAAYRRQGCLTAVVALDLSRSFTRWRRQVAVPTTEGRAPSHTPALSS